jgi:tetratricopeptide (TPR) repeat protein
VVLIEMRARPWLARLYLKMNRLDEAVAQIARCRQIMEAGEDWRGLAGTVARAEAAVEASRGNYEIACRLLESALAIHRTYHAAWDEADTLELWGRVLAAAGDKAGAEEKFDAALENHRSRGVGPRILEWLNAEKMRALGGSPQSQQIESKLARAFRKEGEFWTITFAGTTLRLKDAKGLHYIAYLLARPGQRIHVLDLIEAVEGSAANGRMANRAESEGLRIVRDIGGADPSIDTKARSEYRARLHDLHCDLDEADRMNDLGRAESLRIEIEMVGQQLTGSSGPGGHARAASVSAERARGAVSKNIRSILEKIRRENPALGRHFTTAIGTGYFCAYQQDPDRPISWQL